MNAAEVPYKTDPLLAPAPARFLRQVENQFVNHSVRTQRGLTETEFENQKTKFLNGADAKQIILCMNLLRVQFFFRIACNVDFTSTLSKLALTYDSG